MAIVNHIIPWRRRRSQVPAAHYIAFLVPSVSGLWRVVFPDIAGCEACGSTIHEAACAAAAALERCAESKGPILPLPRSLSEIKHDQEWLSRNGIALTEAIVTMIPLWSSLDRPQARPRLQRR